MSGPAASVSAVLQATEDEAAMAAAARGALGVEAEAAGGATGHYGNPVTVLRAAARGGAARELARRLYAGLGEADAAELRRALGSVDPAAGLRVRLDKQALARGRLELDAGGAVEVRLRAPVYGGSGAAGAYAELLGARGP